MNSHFIVRDHTGVLTSWKEIASHLGKGVRTVQRWERELGLPVRRPNASQRHVVVAFPQELDDWLRSRLSPRVSISNGRSQLAFSNGPVLLTLKLREDAEKRVTTLARLLAELRQNRTEQSRLRRELAEQRTAHRR